MPIHALLLAINAICGAVLDALLIATISAKCKSAAKYRTNSIKFSNNCVVTCFGGQPMLTFRICDWQKCSLIECEMIVKLVKKFKHSNKLHNAISDHSVCRLYPAGEADCRLSLVKPSNFIHLIDDCSPMWNFLDQQGQNDASDQNSILNRSCQSNDSEWPENSFINSTNKSSKSKSHGIKNPLERVEIIVILEGIVEATGMPCMLRTSYSQEEILWGYDFEPLYQVNKNDGSLMIDFDKFNQAGLGVFHFSENFLEQICYYFIS